MRVVSVDTETVRGKPWSVQTAEEFTEFGVQAGMFYCTQALEMAVVKECLEDDGVLTILHNAKFDLKVLSQLDIHPAHTECTMQMAYLLGEPRLSLKVLAYRIAGIKMQTYDQVTRQATQDKARAYLQQVLEMDWSDPEPIMTTGKDGNIKLSFPKNIKGKVDRLLNKAYADSSISLYSKWGMMDEDGGRGQVEAVLGNMERAYLDEVDPQIAEEYAKLDAEATFAIYPYLHAEIEEYGLQEALERDMDCIPMIIEMEDNGVLLDVAELESLKRDLDVLTNDTQADINYLAGHYVNPRSSQQVIALLQDEGIYTDMETSTDASVLDQYREHVIVNKIQDYRAYTKLQSTYVEGLMKSVGADGRIHTQFSTTRTETGRLASCLPGYTRISTLYGNTRIDEICRGELVWTHASKFQKVLNIFDNGLACVFRIALENGAVIDCTSNHRLLTINGWLSLEEIYEHLQETFSRPHVVEKSNGSLHGGRQTCYCRDCETLWGKLSHDLGNYQERFGRRGIQGREISKEIQKQNDGEEPYVGVIQRATSQLQRGYQWWKRISNYIEAGMVHWLSNRQARTTPSSSHVPSTRDNRNTKGVCGTPHQWGQDGQQDKQPHFGVAWGTPRSAPKYSPIYSVQYVGVLRVYDLEVETDHCFLADGIYVHNSKPNLQNIPVRTELGRRIRKAFISERSEY